MWCHVKPNRQHNPQNCHAMSLSMLSYDMLVLLLDVCAALDIFQLANVNTFFKALTRPKRKQIKEVINKLKKHTTENPLHLPRFSAYGRGFGEEGMNALSKGFMGKLEVLLLATMDDAAANAFPAVITSGVLRNLKDLTITNNKFCVPFVEALSNAIAKVGMVNLTTLSLSNNHLGDAGMTTFTSAIASGGLPNLQHLSLDRNNIGNDGMVSLVSVMMMLEKLTFLYLRQNVIGDVGMEAFASSISNGYLPKLTKLNFGCNRICTQGMTAFATSISVFNGLPSLKTVFFYGNPGDVREVVLALKKTRGVCL